MNMRDTALLVLIFAVSGCASAGKIKSWPEEKLHYSIYAADEKKETYREEFVRRHPEWPEPVRTSVLSGKVEVGMSEAQVLAGYGKPQEILAGSHEQKDPTVEREHALWIYPNMYLVFDDGVLTRKEEVMKVEVKYSLIEKARHLF